jgi:hypothetical protein
MPGVDQADRIHETFGAASLAFDGTLPFGGCGPSGVGTHPMRPYVVVLGVRNDDDAVAAGAIDVDN